MALVCILSPCRFCSGCGACNEQKDPEEERDNAIDRAYDKLEEEKWKHLK